MFVILDGVIVRYAYSDILVAYVCHVK